MLKVLVFSWRDPDTAVGVNASVITGEEGRQQPTLRLLLVTLFPPPSFLCVASSACISRELTPRLMASLISRYAWGVLLQMLYGRLIGSLANEVDVAVAVAVAVTTT